jgi:hypothetical protein
MQNFEILTETQMEKGLQRSDERGKMKKREEDIKQSQKKSPNRREEMGLDVGK